METIACLDDFFDDFPLAIGRADIWHQEPVRYNRRFVQLFGWEPEVIGELSHWFELAYPDPIYRAQRIQAWSELVEMTEMGGEVCSEPITSQITCKDGSLRHCEIRYYRKHRYVYGIFTDITPQVSAQTQLETVMNTDPLTHVYNRRNFNHALGEVWMLSQKLRQPVTLILCDIDNFGQINAKYGYLSGDQVLIHVAGLLRSHLDLSTDSVARFGGKEFAVLRFPGDTDAAIALCRMIQEKLELMKTFHDTVERMPTVTMSFGIVTRTAGADETAESFVNDADRAMFYAKTETANRIILFTETGMQVIEPEN